MKSRSQIAVLAALLVMAQAVPPQSIAAGRSTTPAVNTILNGKGVPKPSLGIDGDFYIDTRSLLIYGPKKKGKWPTPQSIQGPTGPAGSDGKNGNDGRAVTSTASAITGPQGPQGPTGPQGLQGEKGEAGAPGVAGAVGPAGAPGSPGPAGANGSNGAQGPAGPTGATGPAGITNLIYGEITFNELSGSVGTGEYVQINNFEAKKSYLVRVHLVATLPNDSSEYFLPLSLSVTSSISGAVAQYSYFLAHGYSYRSGLGRYENAIEAEVVLDGHAIDVAYGITLLVTAGRTTVGMEAVRIVGTYVIQEVDKAQSHA